MKTYKILILVWLVWIMGFVPYRYDLPYVNRMPYTREIDLPLTALPYSTENSKTFAAQVFNYPITQANFKAYLTDFDFYTSRVTISGFEADQPGACLESLRRNTPTYEKIWEKNESLVFNISKMPKWLSDSSDGTPLAMDQAWKTYHAHQPKDYKTWKTYIKEIVGYLKSIQPPGKRVYFEIWNEPDLDYWLDTTDDFLRLFVSTVEAVREADPKALVGGPAVCNYYGRIDDNRKSLITEVLSYCKQKNIQFDFVSFHSFTYAFYENMESATIYIQDLLKTLCYTYAPEIIVTEWNSPSDIRGSKTSCSAMMNGYYSFWKFGITRHTWAVWEDFEPKKSNDYGLLSREKGDEKRGLERPVYSGFYYMNELTKDSQGIYVWEDPSGFKMVISKKIGSENEYQCIGWNFINEPDVRASLYISKVIPTEELLRDYKDSKTIKKYIHLGRSINGKRDLEFKEANRLYTEDLEGQETVLDFEFSISGIKNFTLSNAKSIRSVLANKTYKKEGNILKMQIQNNEVVCFTIKLEK
jgi:hypothetical protein